MYRAYDIINDLDDDDDDAADDDNLFFIDNQ